MCRRNPETDAIGPPRLGHDPHKLERDGLMVGEWEENESGRKRRWAGERLLQVIMPYAEDSVRRRRHRMADDHQPPASPWSKKPVGAAFCVEVVTQPAV